MTDKIATVICRLKEVTLGDKVYLIPTEKDNHHNFSYEKESFIQAVEKLRSRWRGVEVTYCAMPAGAGHVFAIPVVVGKLVPSSIKYENGILSGDLKTDFILRKLEEGETNCRFDECDFRIEPVIRVLPTVNVRKTIGVEIASIKFIKLHSKK